MPPRSAPPLRETFGSSRHPPSGIAQSWARRARARQGRGRPSRPPAQDRRVRRGGGSHQAQLLWSTSPRKPSNVRSERADLLSGPNRPTPRPPRAPPFPAGNLPSTAAMLPATPIAADKAWTPRAFLAPQCCCSAALAALLPAETATSDPHPHRPCDGLTASPAVVIPLQSVNFSAMHCLSPQSAS